MDGPRDCHTEWSKSDREGQILYDIAYMWTDREGQIPYDIAYMLNLKKGYKWTDLQNRNKVTNVENNLMVTRG